MISTRTLALTQSRQFRTCPPPNISDKPEYQTLYRQHRAICPYCSSDQKESLREWEKLAEQLTDIFEKEASMKKRKSGSVPLIGKEPDEPIEAGQFRHIKPEQSRWRNGYYFNPPLVLVLESKKTPSDTVLTAQVYHDIELAGPGDLILTEEQTNLGNLFIECWNTYPVKIQNLDQCVAHLSTKIVQQILKMKNESEFLPDWAMMLRPFKDHHDVRIFFRKLETEVGYVFTAQPVQKWMEQLVPADDLKAILQNLIPDTYWLETPSTVEETFALAQVPHAKTGAMDSETTNDSTRHRFFAKLIAIKNGNIEQFESIQGVMNKLILNNRLMISGQIKTLPKTLVQSRLICFWQIESEPPMDPSRIEWDDLSGTFYAEFDLTEDTGHPEMALVCEVSDEELP